MTPELADSRDWSRRRIWGTVGALVIVQFCLIWWFGERPGTSAPQPSAIPHLILSSRPATELALVNDPTVSARPNARGFSGRAWMAFPAPAYPSVDWTERERLLQPPVEQLGSGLLRFVETNSAVDGAYSRHSEPPLEHTEFYSMLNLARGQSTLRVTGDLASRKLEAELVLKTWAPTNQMVLRNTEVLVGVSAGGRVFSAMPDPHGQSGMKEADDEALRLARGARFAPIEGESDAAAPVRLTHGRLIFEWCSAAPPATNPPVVGP